MSIRTFTKDKHLFDNSNYPADSPYYFNENKKVIDKMKDEKPGCPVIEFVGLRSKMYSYINDNNRGGGKTANGVKKNVVRRVLKVPMTRNFGM